MTVPACRPLSRNLLSLCSTLALFACQGELASGGAGETDGADEAAAADDFKVEEKIVGGRVETGYPAVGALLTADGGLCTGTVVAPRWVVTAAHCLEGGVSGAVFAFGNDIDSPSAVVNVSAGRQHPQYDANNIVNDIALIRLAQDAPVAAMPRAGSLASAEGSSLTFVGFGITSGSASNSGIKRSVTMPLSQLDGTTFSYGVRGKNTCSGDSGGPAFIVQAGQVRIAGVTSYGDASCRSYGVDTRVDVYASWIDQTIGAASGGGGTPVPTPPAADPCGGLTYLGECSGSVARWCENGQIKSNDCARGGQACGWVDNQTGYYCTAAAGSAPDQQPVAPPPAQDACGGVDYLGRCSGSTAQWCDNGRLAQRNCASFGQGCGFVDNQVGYYCR